MSLELKIASLENLPFIVEVYNSIIPGGQITADLNPVSVADWTPWFKQHNTEIRPVWLLMFEGKACGWMSFSDYKSRSAYDITAEISIYLDEHSRGKGLGGKFIRLGLSEIRKRGLKNVMAVIYAANRPSITLFESIGFEKWGLLPKVCEVKGEEKDVIILGLRL
ncbi:MAG: N-acetyltransferase family protein [Chitinophagales bacterium]